MVSDAFVLRRVGRAPHLEFLVITVGELHLKRILDVTVNELLLEGPVLDRVENRFVAPEMDVVPIAMRIVSFLPNATLHMFRCGTHQKFSGS